MPVVLSHVLVMPPCGRSGSDLTIGSKLLEANFWGVRGRPFLCAMPC